jgi:DNA polymerase III epsilon subunit-like protein
MKYLIFDTETTGFPRFPCAPVEDLLNWPRIVQLAWALCDENGNRLRTACHIIRPKGFQIPDGMVHGITQAQALGEGRPLAEAMNQFLFDLLQSDAAVCHNYGFDAPITGAEFLRLGWLDPLPGLPGYCTMRQAAKWAGSPKRLTLDKLHRLCGYGGVTKPHDAAADVDATADCFFHLLHTAPEIFRTPYYKVSPPKPPTPLSFPKGT